MRNLLLLAALFIGFASNTQSQINEPVFVRDSLDGYIERAMHSWNIPGLAVAIVKDNKVVLARGYGIRGLNDTRKVDENTLFMIGSNTKAFTATLLSWLQYDQKCSLNDKVVKWLPDFKMKDPWVGKELNLTDILCHRIGMETFQGDFMYWTSNLSRTEVIEKFGQLAPMYGFRTKWGYTNAGFGIAGECIRQITGESWEASVKKRIFDPLEMTGSVALSAAAASQPNIACPHTSVFDTLKVIPFPLIDNIAPAGSISSSVNDMSHWVICQLGNGQYNGKQVIPLAVIEETRKPQSIEGNSIRPFNTSHFRLYGLGWELSDYEGRKIVSHTGGVNGFVTSVTLVPEEKLGIVVLTNTDANNLYEALKWEILDAYLNLPYRNYSNFYLRLVRMSNARELESWKAMKDTVAMNIKTSLPISKFAGHYTHPVYGYLDIAADGKKLKMTFEHHPGLIGTLEPLGGSRFLCTYSDPGFGIKVLPFRIEDNNVKSFVLRVADFVEFTDYTFTRQ